MSVTHKNVSQIKTLTSACNHTHAHNRPDPPFIHITHTYTTTCHTHKKAEASSLSHTYRTHPQVKYWLSLTHRHTSICQTHTNITQQTHTRDIQDTHGTNSFLKQIMKHLNVFLTGRWNKATTRPDNNAINGNYLKVQKSHLFLHQTW